MKKIYLIIIMFLISISTVHGNDFELIDKNIKKSVKNTTLQFSTNIVKIINQNTENVELFKKNELKNLKILLKKMVNFVKETKNRELITPQLKGQIDKYENLINLRIKEAIRKIDFSNKEYYKILKKHPELGSNPDKSKKEYIKELVYKENNPFIKHSPHAKQKIKKEWEPVFEELNELRKQYSTETN